VNPSVLADCFTFLQESQHWSLEQFQAYQVEQLQQVLGQAFTHVPYYRNIARELGCRAEDFTSLADLAKFPLLEKTALRGHEHEFLHEQIDYRKCNHFHTSGTTGTALHIYESRAAFSKRYAFVSRLRSWTGVPSPMMPHRAQFTGRNLIPASQNPRQHIYWRYNYPGRALVCSMSNISAETVPYFAKALRDYRPDLIDGYPSALSLIARLCLHKGIELPRPKAVITTAETLFPEQRMEIKNAFGCPVYNQYAATEPSCFCADCEQGNMHISPEYGIVELVDDAGNLVPPGQEGQIVVTSFLNPAMPIIRYRLGDMAVARDPNERCSCGRQMPMLERVLGRIDDILYAPGRGYILGMNRMFYGLDDVIEGQVVQEALDRIHVLIVPADNFSEQTRTKLHHKFVERFGDQVQIEVECVPAINRGANGKFRQTISSVRHLYPLYESESLVAGK